MKNFVHHARPALAPLLIASALSLALPAHAQVDDTLKDGMAGRTDEAATTTEVVTGPRNLLHPDYCEIIAAPDDRAAKLLEGGFDLPADELSQAIYGFKDEKGVTLTGIRVFINASDDQAIKSVQLLVSDSPDGPFVAAVKAGDTKNLKMFKTKGWQEFNFPPASVRFFKLEATAHNHAWVKVENDGAVNGLQLIGEPCH